MGKEEYYEQLCTIIDMCLEDDNKHGILIAYDSKTGQVRTYSVNAAYDIAQMMVGTAAAFIGDDMEERVVN